MKSAWTIYTNAKSEQNALVLLNKIKKYLPRSPQGIEIDGDRYSGHCLTFILDHGDVRRDVFIYQLFSHGEKLANSWTTSGVGQDAKAWSNRSRIAGIQQLEWVEK